MHTVMVMIWTVGTGFALNLILKHLCTILMALFCATLPVDGERQILAANLLGWISGDSPVGTPHMSPQWGDASTLKSKMQFVGTFPFRTFYGYFISDWKSIRTI